jgi:hypothetical protein
MHRASLKMTLVIGEIFSQEESMLVDDVWQKNKYRVWERVGAALRREEKRILKAHKLAGARNTRN